MTDTLIISEVKLRSFTDLNNNVDDKLLTTAIQVAQDIYLQRLISTALYQKIMNDIDNNTLSGNYLTLVDDFIVPYLIYSSYWEALEYVYMRPRNNGLLTPTGGENSANVDQRLFEKKRQLADNKSQFYGNRLTQYLIQNENLFPEIQQNAEFWKQYPDYQTGYRSPFVFSRWNQWARQANAAGMRMADSKYPYMPYGSNVFYPGCREC
jgi:hypothetical protein